MGAAFGPTRQPGNVVSGRRGFDPAWPCRVRARPPAWRWSQARNPARDRPRHGAGRRGSLPLCGGGGGLRAANSRRSGLDRGRLRRGRERRPLSSRAAGPRPRPRPADRRADARRAADPVGCRGGFAGERLRGAGRALGRQGLRARSLAPPRASRPSQGLHGPPASCRAGRRNAQPLDRLRDPDGGCGPPEPPPAGRGRGPAGTWRARLRASPGQGACRPGRHRSPEGFRAPLERRAEVLS